MVGVIIIELDCFQKCILHRDLCVNVTANASPSATTSTSASTSAFAGLGARAKLC